MQKPHRKQISPELINPALLHLDKRQVLPEGRLPGAELIYIYTTQFKCYVLIAVYLSDPPFHNAGMGHKFWSNPSAEVVPKRSHPLLGRRSSLKLSKTIFKPPNIQILIIY